jgi:hypothetical protein
MFCAARSTFLLPALFVSALWPAAAGADCLLANPSFELGGTGGAVFAGWNQFGPCGSSATAVHGSLAARVAGPNLGGWDVAGYWQSLDTAPGERWSATVRAWHSSSGPLTGQSRAIVNIEWRGADGNLISYESHTVADAATPVDDVQDFAVQSGPAPVGTASARLLLGVLQSPSDPAPVVFYDQATFDNLGPPTLDDLQWNDFPSGRTVSFSDRTWRVKGTGYYGPGPNLFDAGASAVWVDANGRLHMTIRKVGSSWYSSEVALADALGYGDYIFTTVGRLDALSPNVVLGLFLWQYGTCYDPAYLWWNPYNEIDVEFSRWGNPTSDVAQFVTQPYDYNGNISRFDADFSDGEVTSHAFRWLADRVEYRSWRGGPAEEISSVMIHSWTYTGPHIPRPEQPRVHINLWQATGPPAVDQEVVLDAFTFIPAGGATGAAGGTTPSRGSALSDARPNPFNPVTTIGYTLREAARADIVVYDVSGRRVRVLFSGAATAGYHEVTWDGRNDAGSRVASGLYLYQLRSGDGVETKKMVLLK